jgi:hypothetical protein
LQGGFRSVFQHQGETEQSSSSLKAWIMSLEYFFWLGLDIILARKLFDDWIFFFNDNFD